MGVFKSNTNTSHITEKKLQVLSKFEKVRFLCKSFMLKLIIIVIHIVKVRFLCKSFLHQSRTPPPLQLYSCSRLSVFQSRNNIPKTQYVFSSVILSKMTKKLSAFLSEVSNLTEMPTQHLVQTANLN